jgi:hypothetical protein
LSEYFLLIIELVQILGVIVLYGLDLIKSLFTRLPGFEMMQDKKYDLYCVENNKSKPDNMQILQIGKACWGLMASHDVVKKRSWNREMLHRDLLNNIDDMFEDILSGKLKIFLLGDDPKWDPLLTEYAKEVTLAFKKSVTGVTWSDSEQQDVRDEVTRKLHWIFLGHQYHYEVALPMMTKSTVSAIADTFTRNQSAISEVSVHFHGQNYLYQINAPDLTG